MVRTEQGGGAVVGIGRAAGNQRGPRSGPRNRDCRRNTGGAAADHDHVERFLAISFIPDN